MTVVLSSSAKVSFYVSDCPGQGNKANSLDVNEMKRELENGSDERKQRAMQSILTAMVNGDPASHTLLMPIIRFIVPSKNKTLKKLLLLYLENVNKRDEEGKLRQEMILVWYFFVFPCFCFSILTTTTTTTPS